MKIASRICVFIGFYIIWMVSDGFVLPFIGMMIIAVGGLLAGLSINGKGE